MNTKELELALEQLRSRGEIKALGKAADQDPELRSALLLIARKRGLSPPDDLAGKKLLKALLGRENSARVRKNPIRRDAAFTCTHCGREVSPGGGRVRDHCPHCLFGL
ncbi:MAG: RNHCP domain-containing protein, partial [Myxococcota bacterium]|nr:RNHCP domain-containing protein [Myxococcota bacterium]